MLIAKLPARMDAQIELPRQMTRAPPFEELSEKGALTRAPFIGFNEPDGPAGDRRQRHASGNEPRHTLARTSKRVRIRASHQS